MTAASLPTIPFCGLPTTTRIEVYRPVDGVAHARLDAAFYTCAQHTDAAAAALEAAGLTAYRIDDAPPKACGDGYDFRARKALYAPLEPFAWCERAPEHEPCAERAEHRSRAYTVAPEVQATALITVQLVALLDPPPHRLTFGVFLAITEEGRRIPYLLPMEQVTGLRDRLELVVAFAGMDQ